MLFPEDSDYVGLLNVPINFVSDDRSGTRRCTSVTINEDTIVEYDETFNVILTENSDQLIVQSTRNSTLVTILEDGDSELATMLERLVCKRNVGIV